MTEYDLIRSLATTFPRSPRQKNALFECDAEILEIGGDLWGLTMDEFSPEEDLFTMNNPARLGANLTVATLSDLLASGVKPAFFFHSLSLPKGVHDDFAKGLAAGIREILEAADCAFCGGDFGMAEQWHYTGFAMGPVRSSTPLTRKLPAKPQTLWATGTLGDANLAAYTGSATPTFELRMKEASTISSLATGCIDTSGGFFDALWLLHEQNPQLGFHITLKDIPFTPDIDIISEKIAVPREAALVGGAGEYELLFTTSRENAAKISANPGRLGGATAIGHVNTFEKPGVFIHGHKDRLITVTEPPPCPREAKTFEAYVEAVANYAVKLFGHNA